MCRAAHPAGKYFITAGVAPSKVRTGPAVTLGKQDQVHLKSFHKTRLLKESRSVTAIAPEFPLIYSAKILNFSAQQLPPGLPHSELLIVLNSREDMKWKLYKQALERRAGG